MPHKNPFPRKEKPSLNHKRGTFNLSLIKATSRPNAEPQVILRKSTGSIFNLFLSCARHFKIQHLFLYIIILFHVIYKSYRIIVHITKPFEKFTSDYFQNTIALFSIQSCIFGRFPILLSDHTHAPAAIYNASILYSFHKNKKPRNGCPP